MGPFLLIMLILDAQTGDTIDSKVMGDPYPSIEECARAAINEGPNKSEDNKAALVFCQEAGNRYTRTVAPVREPLSIG